ncbi:MAG: adenylyltransferase/cytidyltransferase family protein [Candidatus Altiarchaeales archaeon]|nr:adenylyltransferase/cytidyltransferase family protein [Candidatus Altiarchaeales archaeon]MBD3417186.1 adenylyltransferase/cytidyltransferase family protein [Candidatus Altiarchaeales archaeon]
MATGVFEILHPGHLMYLEEARKLGDRLVVVVARDETAQERKRRPVISAEQRLHMVKSLKPVDDAVLGGDDMYSTIESLNPDVLALGPDQDFNEEELQAELESRGLKTKVVRVGKYWVSGLHSSKIIVDLIKKQ